MVLEQINMNQRAQGNSQAADEEHHSEQANTEQEPGVDVGNCYSELRMIESSISMN